MPFLNLKRKIKTNVYHLPISSALDYYIMSMCITPQFIIVPNPLCNVIEIDVKIEIVLVEYKNMRFKSSIWTLNRNFDKNPIPSDLPRSCFYCLPHSVYDSDHIHFTIVLFVILNITFELADHHVISSLEHKPPQ